jgi:ubiquinone/menaquinone biosynthesis C-methylase UbiE
VHNPEVPLKSVAERRITTAEEYESWYATPRGRWIADAEFALMLKMLHPTAQAAILDVGSGTGHFSRRLAALGSRVVEVDPDIGMLTYARGADGTLPGVAADARALPFADSSFDYCIAIASLCFIQPPAQALAEMWRVCRLGVFLGLLNQRSVLHAKKRDRGGYRGARWDTPRSVKAWTAALHPRPSVTCASAIFLPGGHWLARQVESWLPSRLLWGGFLAVVLR